MNSKILFPLAPVCQKKVRAKFSKQNTRPCTQSYIPHDIYIYTEYSRAPVIGRPTVVTSGLESPYSRSRQVAQQTVPRKNGDALYKGALTCGRRLASCRYIGTIQPCGERSTFLSANFEA